MNRSPATHSLKKHSKSFYWAGLLLPGRTLTDAATLYAFCRAMDDAVDERNMPQEIRDALLQHQQGCGELSGLMMRYHIPLPVMHAFLQGLLDDVAPVKHEVVNAVLRFGYGVAGTVGIMMSHILGRTDPVTLYHAIDLGVAMQLVNIARDHAEDVQLKRDYIPLSETQTSLVILAENYFESGLMGVHKLPAAMRPAIMTAAYLYREIGRKIVANPDYAKAHRVVISKPHKIWLTLRAVLACLIVPKPLPHDVTLHHAFSDMPSADRGT